MGSLFSKKPKSRITEQDEAVLQLKVQRDKLKQYSKKIEVQLGRDREVAKKLLRLGKKDRAKALLKKKRYQEQLIDRTIQQLDSIERMIHDVEFASIEMEVVKNLKQGNECLQTLNRLMSFEDVESILEDTKEAAEYQQEINRLISSDMSDIDMQAVEDELADLIAEDELIPEPILLPDVPKDEILSEDKTKVKQSEKPKREALLA